MPAPFDCITEFNFVESALEPADVILIPGGSHPQLMERAAELHKKGVARWILPSGGFNAKLAEYETEWAFLRSIGVRLGVPEEAILKEDRASHTFENALFSCEVLRAHNLPFSKAILVCKAYHARRALLTYQSVFPPDTSFLVAPVIDKRGITKDTWFLHPEHRKVVMGEVVKIGQYFEDKIAGWIR